MDNVVTVQLRLHFWNFAVASYSDYFSFPFFAKDRSLGTVVTIALFFSILVAHSVAPGVRDIVPEENGRNQLQ
jgi:hypothetical protein